MTKLTWNDAGTRIYEVGIDRGVLYLENGSGVPWNGLTSVEEKVDENKSTPAFFDGIKFIDSSETGDFAASITAYTFPDEFLQFEGTTELAEGLFIDNQKSKTFSMSYRTLTGNDLDGDQAGYKIHILYNLTAVVKETTYQTINNDPIDFGWDVSSKYEIPPDLAPLYRPTSHAIIDSRYIPQSVLSLVESRLYGDEFHDAQFPTLEELGEIIAGYWFLVVDNDNGTWTATAPDEFEMITMLDDTTFELKDINVVYLNEDKYRISSGISEDVDVESLPPILPKYLVWYIGDNDPFVFGNPGDIPIPADYLNLGYAQPAFWRPSTGQWFVQGHTGVFATLGQSNDVLLPGDYLKLGYDQPAVYRPGATNQWRVLGEDPFTFGMVGDVPDPGIWSSGEFVHAIYRPSEFRWYNPWGNISFAEEGDIIIRAVDYTGDTIVQPCVYRPSTNEWIYRHSSTTDSVVVEWAEVEPTTDIFCPGDFMHEGNAQRAFYRPSTGEFHIFEEDTIEHVPNGIPVSADYGSGFVPAVTVIDYDPNVVEEE